MPPRTHLLRIGLMLALCMAGVATAADGQPRVRVLAEQFWPYSFTPGGDYASAPRGILVSFAGEVLDAAGLEHEVALLPWPRVMKHMREDSNQMVLTMIRSAEREGLVHWIGPVANIEHALYGLAADRARHPTSLDEARHLSVASVPDDVAHGYLLAQGFTRIVTTSNYLKGLEMLARGRVDLYPGNSALVIFQCTQLPQGCPGIEQVLPLTDLEQQLYFAMSRSTDPQLVDRVRAAFARLHADGRLAALEARVLAATTAER